MALDSSKDCEKKAWGYLRNRPWPIAACSQKLEWKGTAKPKQRKLHLSPNQRARDLIFDLWISCLKLDSFCQKAE